MKQVQEMIGDTFRELADYLTTGAAPRAKIALTGTGSEHGEENAMQAAVMAAQRGVDVTYIGTLTAPGITTVPADSDEAAHAAMTALLDSGAVDGAVTMHFPFPIGVSTVGRAVTPATGREMLIATTTGTSSTDRVEGMILNAIYGVITAKASGIARPTVGILNVDGARQCEAALRQLAENGYELQFAESSRADGGAVMRGNDVLQGTPDVLVCDSLTGNVLSKILSAYTSGGSFESVGYGYGPGIGRNYDKLILIISRASGAPVIANAITFGAQLVQGKLFEVARAEFDKAEQAGLRELLAKRKESKTDAPAAAVPQPPKEPVTAGIPGIEVMDIESAVQVIWQAGLYAESAMGCTGPLVLVSEANREKAVSLLAKAGFIGA